MRKITAAVCIYCKKSGKPVSREHVIPEAFGKFGGQTPSLHCVCLDCNNLFSHEFEQEVYRGSLEALARWRFGLKPLDARKQIDTQRIRLNVAGGKFDGLRLDPITNDIEAQLEVRRKETSERVQLTLPEILHLSDAEVAKLDFTKSKLVVWDPGQTKLFADALRRFGLEIDPSVVLEKTDVPAGTRFSGHMSVSMDVKTGRAIAKVSFNYLARTLGSDYALKYCFDGIRDFILRGVLPPRGPVIASGMQESTKRGVPANPAHYLTLHLQEPSIVYGRVVLFSGYTYHVALSMECPPTDVHPALNRGFGHIFHVFKQKVSPMPQFMLDDWNSRRTI